MNTFGFAQKGRGVVLGHDVSCPYMEGEGESWVSHVFGLDELVEFVGGEEA
jgi:hypothetical protein